MNTVNMISEQEIDDLVINEADEESAWEEPIAVKKGNTTLQMPAELAKRAKFLAQLHHKQDVESWITQIVRERIELEEGAFLIAKREMSLT